MHFYGTWIRYWKNCNQPSASYTFTTTGIASAMPVFHDGGNNLSGLLIYLYITTKRPIMKTITIAIALIIYSSIHLLAQENKPGQPIKGVIVKGGKNPGGNISLSANGGTSSSTGVSSGWSLNPNIGLELFWGGFGIGADAGMFTSKMDNAFHQYSEALKGMDAFGIHNGSNKWTSTYVLAGPQYTFHKRALALTFSLKGGITHRTAPEFAIVDNISGTNVMAYQPPADDANNVFTLKPGISLACNISGRWAVVANVQYLLQPGQQETTISYRDLSHVDFTGNGKELSAQLSNQPYITSTTNGPDKYMSAGVGLRYTFRTGHVNGGSAAQRHRLRGKVTKPGTLNLETSPVENSATNAATATAEEKRTYTGGRKNEEQPAAKGISEKGVSRPYKEDVEFLNSLFVNNGNEKVLDPKLFKLVTSDSELKGMKVSFKKDHKVYRYLGDQQRIVEILQSANRPAGCTDCTTRECNGKVYDCACVNGFCYCIICIEITKLSELAE